MRTEVTSVTTRPHPISNTFHLIMTICTGGLWIPVWIFMARGHKTTTRAPVSTSTDYPGGRLDPEYMANHVPGSAEYKARHTTGPFDVTDMRANGATSAEIRRAVIAEARRRSGQ